MAKSKNNNPKRRAASAGRSQPAHAHECGGHCGGCHHAPTVKGGVVYLVGAGPGDAGLLTLRGLECLQAADVVIYDHLVNPDLLKFVPREAERIPRGKRSHPRYVTQEKINELMTARAHAGKVVVRLKGGDPFLFGRGGEEAEAIREAGVAFEVVPGVTSATAVPAYAGIPVTHRGGTSALCILTGHEDPAKPESAIDWDAVAKFPGTRVIMMGLKRIESVAESLVTHGCPAETPVAVIQSGTRARQRTVAGTLRDIAAKATAANIAPPALVVVGDVVRWREKLNWFETRPLFGQRIVITRTREQASELSAQLSALGADVWELPTIKLLPPANPSILREAVEGLGEYDWIIFSSPNSVEFFFEEFFRQYPDIRSLGFLKIAAMGPGTAQRLRELHLEVDLQPEEAVAESMVKAFDKAMDVANLRILWPRADLARDVLSKKLEELGAIVDSVEAYRNVIEDSDPNGIVQRLTSEGADCVVFASSSSATNFAKLIDVPKLRAAFPKLRFASIGPITTETAEKLGMPISIQPADHTMPALIEAIRVKLS